MNKAFLDFLKKEMALSYLMIFQNHTISDSHHFQYSTPLKKSSSMPIIWQKREEKSCF